MSDILKTYVILSAVVGTVCHCSVLYAVGMQMGDATASEIPDCQTW